MYENILAYKQKYFFICNSYFSMLQVAHFYNSIDQQMIQSQKPMMLQSALAFEQIIKVKGFLFVVLIFGNATGVGV